ncbi:hypothetical protein DPMN_185220 [Dreissena polymorpha]|uniref:Uncharacterized protein n=1 Tax=Dreissena polymorpha TaxID=45954 RepID=A0A9D4DLH4_DREPO|nr:hypothetical protein DPMN_185220 [Dreissena polymorpha]
MQNAGDVKQDSESPAVHFFSKKKITKAVKPKPKILGPPFKVTGNMVDENNVQQLTAAANKSALARDLEDNEKDTPNGPQASGLSKQRLSILSPEDANSDEDIATDSESCCVRKRFEPADIDKFPYITLVTLGKKGQMSTVDSFENM